MSPISSRGRISAKPFASVPSLADLPPIQRAEASVSDVSSLSGVDDFVVDLSEGCFVTKTIKYTHQISHWVNATQDEDAELEDLIAVMRVTRTKFALDQPSNLVFLENFVHTALDLYAFVAITASLPTLNALIEMVQSDNNRRQLTIDETGINPHRSLKFNIPSVTRPEYELVALHPEHFLPCGSMLTVYEPNTATYKHYVVATDRHLRESLDPSSPHLPPFHHVSEDRAHPSSHHPNVFLVVINAEIKFRRYFEMAQPAIPLPADVIHLMHRTMDLVNLLYWEPVPKKGSPGEAALASWMDGRQKDSPHAARPGPVTTEGDPGEENIIQDKPIPSGLHAKAIRRHRHRWLADVVDLETRMAYGRALMSGHDRDYDPALFEDAIPLNDPHLYSERANVAEWQRGVSS